MKSRKLLALLLAIFMLASLVVPVSAEVTPDAEDTTNPVVGYSAALVEKKDLSQIPEMKDFDATNTNQKEYKIVDVEDWDALDAAITSTAPTTGDYTQKYRGLVGYTIYLANDLDFKGEYRTPLGSGILDQWYVNGFAGVFDGQGHIIKNLTVCAEDVSTVNSAYFGLFAKLTADRTTSGSAIKNLIIDETVTYDPYKNINKATITPSNVMTASLVGVIDSGYGDPATSQNLVGKVTIFNVMNCADFGFDAKQAGGLVTFAKCADVTIKNCTNAGDMTQTGTKDGKAAGDNGIGGILGVIGEANATKKQYFISATVENCRNTGDITTNLRGTVGGIVGSALTTSVTLAHTRTLNIKNCINNGATACQDTATGWSAFAGIFGWVNSGWTVKITGCKNYAVLGANPTKTATQITSATTGVTKSNCTEAKGQLDFTYNMTAQYYQLSKTANAGKYSLRLVALHNDIEAYDSFGYEIVISYKTTVEGQETTKTVKATLDGLTTVNTSIAADNGMGAMLVSATELGGEYVSAVRIDNISTAYGTLTVTLTPKMTAKGTTEPTSGTPITFTVTPNYN